MVDGFFLIIKENGLPIFGKQLQIINNNMLIKTDWEQNSLFGRKLFSQELLSAAIIQFKSEEKEIKLSYLKTNQGDYTLLFNNIPQCEAITIFCLKGNRYPSTENYIKLIIELSKINQIKNFKGNQLEIKNEINNKLEEYLTELSRNGGIKKFTTEIKINDNVLFEKKLLNQIKNEIRLFKKLLKDLQVNDNFELIDLFEKKISSLLILYKFIFEKKCPEHNSDINLLTCPKSNCQFNKEIKNSIGQIPQEVEESIHKFLKLLLESINIKLELNEEDAIWFFERLNAVDNMLNELFKQINIKLDDNYFIVNLKGNDFIFKIAH